jgi:hypothetical protein
MGESSKGKAAGSLAQSRVDTNTTWERVLQKLARSEEAQPDCSLTRTLNKPTKPICSAANESGEAEEGVPSANATT